MTRGTVQPRRFNDLLRLMDTLRLLHGDLRVAIVVRINAMRDADLPRMQEALNEERAIAARIHEREGLRKQLMDLMGVELGLPKGEGRKMTVSQMAERLPESARAALRRRADGLRRAVAEAAQANRVAASATRTLLHHMQWVFAAMRPAGGSPLTYSSRGEMTPPGGTVLLEATG